MATQLFDVQTRAGFVPVSFKLGRRQVTVLRVLAERPSRLFPFVRRYFDVDTSAGRMTLRRHADTWARVRRDAAV